MNPIDRHFEHPTIEAECRALWDRTGIYDFDADGDAPIFSVDTPPPYVSAAHLHVGHAMSYSQAEFIVRYQRMRGRRIFYPMGFDDNGLPTERYVEKTHGLDKRRISRSDFRALCLEETTRGARGYEELWRSLGLSVDWSLRYSTIDSHCRRTAQLSFVQLFEAGRIYRSDEPVLWDTHFETALAQADLATLERRAQLHELAFAGPDGELCIATTRPELLPACVALYCHPDDPRYKGMIGASATVPIYGHAVKICADREVDPAFGTGIMMVCTFGDGEDVRRWKRDGLPTRVCIGRDGRMLASAGDLEGLPSTTARKRLLKRLKEDGMWRGATTVQQSLSVGGRSEQPVEFAMVPQWFVRVLDLKDQLLARSGSLQWNPAWMKARLDQWIDGLKWDWNISRQRFYGVPMPVWFCEACGQPVLARTEDLPVDPLEDACPMDACAGCGHGAFRGDPDVMDTWMTSSMTPYILGNRAGSAGRTAVELPLSLRVQGFEIVRTWLFYTLLKAHLHGDELPWSAVMISGWGLNEQGKKISKRDLEKPGFNRYAPGSLIDRYGADALRHWAAGSQLGQDLRYRERDVKAGRKLVVKLWNAARFGAMYLEDFDPGAPRVAVHVREPADRWMLARLDGVVRTVGEALDGYDYATGRQALDRFFWGTFCDDWLELIKDRFWSLDEHSDGSRESARASLWEALRVLLGLYAPYLPFVTEALYQRIYAEHEGSVSLHVTAFPEPRAQSLDAVPAMDLVVELLGAVRSLRTEARIPQNRRLAELVLDASDASPEVVAQLEQMAATVRAAARCEVVRSGAAERAVGEGGLRVGIVAGVG